MQNFNYDASAELFPSRRYAKTQQARYRRFSRAAEALRYVIEELPGKQLAGTILEVNDQRFEGNALRSLYDAPGYPLPRQEVEAEAEAETDSETETATAAVA